MINDKINARFDRIERMIKQIREFSNDTYLKGEIAEGDLDADKTIQEAIDMLADDIHDCAQDHHDDGDNPYPMDEREFDLFWDLIEGMNN